MIRVSLSIGALCWGAFACSAGDEVVFLTPQDLIEYEQGPDAVLYFQVQEEGVRLQLTGEQVPEFVRESVETGGPIRSKSSGGAAACVCVKGRVNQPSRDNPSCYIDRLWKCGWEGVGSLVEALKSENHFDSPPSNREASRPSLSEITVTKPTANQAARPSLSEVSFVRQHGG